MAWNGLVKKLKRGFGRAVRIGMALAVLGSASCKLPIPTPNNLPTAILSVAPTSGDAPLETIIQLDGADLDGEEDIIEYKIGEDKNNDGDIDDYNELIESGSSPIVDYPVTFYASGTKKIYGQVMDSQGAIGKDGPFLVDVYQPGNNPPEIISTPVTEVNEGEQYYYDVDAIDSDLEDTLEYSLIQKLTWLEINSQTGLITGTVPKSPGDYPVEVKVSDGKDYDTQPYTLIVKNLIDISGTLEDNETDSLQTGIIKVYGNLENLLKTVDVPAGNFDFQIDQVVSEIVLQARIMDGITDKSYIRTIRLDGTQDYSGLEIRAVPYDGPLPYDNGLIPEQITSQEFKTFMEETNFLSPDVAGNSSYGLKKWNFEELSDLVQHPKFKGITIVNPNPYPPYDSFTNPNNVKTTLEGSVYYSKPGQIVINIVISDQLPSGGGWGIVVPDETPGNSGGAAAGATIVADQVGHDGYFEGFWAEIKPINESNSRILIHEIYGHGVNYPSHTTLSQSIMNPSSIDPVTNLPYSDFTSADIKGSYIVNEPTYKGMESSDDIMALNFLN